MAIQSAQDRNPPTSDHAKGGPAPSVDAKQLPPESKALALIRSHEPRVYTDYLGKAVIEFPPDYDPIPIISPKFRGLVVYLYEGEYGPYEMLSPQAAKRVEMALTGQAFKGKSPLFDGPPGFQSNGDSVMEAVYFYMIKRRDDTSEPYEDLSTRLMQEVRKHCSLFGIPLRSIPDSAHAFGKRLKAVIPQLGAMGLIVEVRHTNRGTRIRLVWRPETIGPLGDGSTSPTPLLSPDNTQRDKPLRRSDGSDVSELLVKLVALNKRNGDFNDGKETHGETLVPPEL